MKKYEFHFIDGYDNKFKTYTCDAENLQAAKDRFLSVYLPAFEHQITGILENGNLIFEA